MGPSPLGQGACLTPYKRPSLHGLLRKFISLLVKRYERTYADRRKIWACCVSPAFPGHSIKVIRTETDRSGYQRLPIINQCWKLDQYFQTKTKTRCTRPRSRPRPKLQDHDQDQDQDHSYKAKTVASGRVLE